MNAVATQIVPVALGDRSYEIHVGAGLLEQAGSLMAPHLPGKRAIIVTDTNVAVRYAKKLTEALEASGIRVERVVVNPGEASKSFASFESVMEQILALQPDRKTALVALGGGVVGDLTGFAASTLLRGVPFLQVPTSLLAQVDSSVGGKTAINTRAGKNLVGSFYQPQLVLADLDTLKTLPPREMRAGYAEIIKYGLIADADFYQWCLAHAAALLEGDVATLQQAVVKSCQMKAAIVAEDEREADRRALLNFGHTFGHALEAETGFSDTLLHGEAVAMGMVMACALSSALGPLPATVEAELAAHFKTLGMKAQLAEVPAPWQADQIARHFASDKKAESGTLTFVVLDAIGKGRVAKQVDAAHARAVVVNAGAAA
ncbi:MAG: 3-dehydroquinate synthase [Azospirillum brasilense]|nr:MAG: 3-dehydroquinate synthase [Azospirillum brasilense]